MTNLTQTFDYDAEVSLFNKLTDRIFDLATRQGASQCEIGVSKDSGLSAQTRMGEVETVEFNRDSSFGITVYFGKRKGSATTSDLSPEAIDNAVKAACNIAQYTAEDPFSGLADADLMATSEVDLALDYPANIDAEEAIEWAMRCEKQGLNFDQRISNSDGANFNSHRSIRYYANTHGFRAAIPSTRFSLSCVLIAKDMQGMQRDYYYSIARDINDLESATHVGEQAAKKTLNRLGAKKIKTVKAPVLFVPDMSRQLLSHFLGAIRGGNLYRKSSFLLDHLHQQIFPEFVTIDERPLLKKGLASTWFDNEGVATQERDIVHNGVLNGYLLSSYSARKLGMTTTGNAGGIHNCFTSHSDLNYEELIAQMGTGLIVTEVMGQGVNTVTGDYSRGAGGFWVENGKVEHYVKEVTIADNMKNMFQGLQAIGNDFDYRSSLVTGSWLMSDMMIGGE